MQKAYNWCEYPDPVIAAFMGHVRNIPPQSFEIVDPKRLPIWRLPPSQWIARLSDNATTVFHCWTIVSLSTMGCQDSMALHSYRTFLAFLKTQGWSWTGRARIARSLLAIRARKTELNRPYDKELSRLVSPESIGWNNSVLG